MICSTGCRKIHRFLLVLLELSIIFDENIISWTLSVQLLILNFYPYENKAVPHIAEEAYYKNSGNQ